MLLADVVRRRQRGLRHPVEDFLFDYYSVRPGQLSTWHPGIGIALQDAPEFSGRRWYVRDDDLVHLDDRALGAARQTAARQAAILLRATADRPARFTCFGMHEWAMVYGLPEGDTRHPFLPLRYPPDELAGIVERVGVRCSHFDAFRFFTPDAVPLNAFRPTRETQVDLDQPGCLHVTMDLYKWAGKLSPACSSELLLDAFELARDVREVDMRASAYDLREWGHEPIEVENPAGRAAYATLQRQFTTRAEPLREAVLAVARHLAQ